MVLALFSTKLNFEYLFEYLLVCSAGGCCSALLVLFSGIAWLLMLCLLKVLLCWMLANALLAKGTAKMVLLMLCYGLVANALLCSGC